jgi:hypothetical protein
MKRKILTMATVLAATAAAGGAVLAASSHHGPGTSGLSSPMRDNSLHAAGSAHGTTTGMGPGMVMRGTHAAGPMMGAMHGGDATAAEMQGIHDLFANHDRIKRTVTNLPNGIRTVTESDEPQLAQTIKDHTVTMLKRVSEKRDPGLPIESPALRAIFENYDKITTKVETTEKGVIVIQTSDDAATVALLQTHAGEVSAFVEKGMRAVHESMARNGAMGHGMMRRMNMRGHGPAGAQPMTHDHLPDQADPPAGTTR